MKLLNKKKLKVQTAQTKEQTPVAKLEEAIQILKEFQESHETIFQKNRELTEKIEIFTDEAKTYAKEHRCNLDGQSIFVKFTPAMSRWHDATVLEKNLTKTELQAAKALGLFKTVVDEDILKILLNTEKISKDAVKAAYREKEVSIRAEVKEKNS